MAIPVFSGPIPDVAAVTEGSAITSHDTGAFFTGATSYAIDQTPTGLTFNTGTGVLSGTPTESGVTQCKVTATNVDGNTYSNMFKVPVNHAGIAKVHAGDELYRVI